MSSALITLSLLCHPRPLPSIKLFERQDFKVWWWSSRLSPKTDFARFEINSNSAFIYHSQSCPTSNCEKNWQKQEIHIGLKERRAELDGIQLSKYMRWVHTAVMTYKVVTVGFLKSLAAVAIVKKELAYITKKKSVILSRN